MSNETLQHWNSMSDAEQTAYINEAKEHVENFSSVVEPFFLEEATKQAIANVGYIGSDFDKYQLEAIQKFVQCGLANEWGHKFIDPKLDDMVMQVVMAGIKDQPEYHYELVLPYLFSGMQVSTVASIRALCVDGKHDVVKELIDLWHSGEYEDSKLFKVQKLMVRGLEYKDIIDSSDFKWLFSDRLSNRSPEEIKFEREIRGETSY